MDGTLYTPDEAAKLTGLSVEALRKRFLRGHLEGIASKDSNDGKIRARLTEIQLSNLRRPDGKVDGEASEEDGQSSGDLPVQLLSRLADSLERRLSRAEDEAEAARAALNAERRARDEERREWSARLDGITAEFVAMRKGRAATGVLLGSPSNERAGRAPT